MPTEWTELTKKDEELFKAALHAYNKVRGTEPRHWKIVCSGPDRSIYVEIKVAYVDK